MGRLRVLPNLLVAVLCVTLASASAQEPVEPLAYPPGTLDSEIEQIENEVATLLREKAAPGATATAHIDLRIDLRLLRRVLLRRAAPGPHDPAARVAILRQADLVPLIAAADTLDALPEASPAAAAASTLGRRTFDVPTDQHPDDLLRDAGRLVLIALGREQDARALSPARPTRPPGDSQSADEPADASQALAVLASQTRSLNVTVELRRAVEALLADASSDPTLEPQARRAFRAARALAANTGGLADHERRFLEDELAVACLLVRDPRLREGGVRRLQRFDGLLRVADTSGALPDGGGAMAGILAAARRDPRNADTLLQVARLYHDEANRHERLVAAELSPPVARGVTTLRGEFERRRTQLAAMSRQMLQDQDAGLFRPDPATLAAHAAEMRRMNDLIAAVVGAATAAREIEGVLSVRPTGEFERTLVRALVRSAVPGRTDDRDAADAVLLAAGAVADALPDNRAMRETLAAVPDDVASLLGLTRAEVLADRHLEVTSNFARSLASGLLDAVALADGRASLVTFDELGKAVADYGQLTRLLGRSAEAGAWADWSVTREASGAFYEEYRIRLTRAAAAAGTADARGAFDAFSEEARRLAPMTTLLGQATAYADEASPRDPTVAAAARLGTPSKDQPFETFRLASAGMDLWMRVRLEPDADRRVGDLLLARLRRDAE